MTLPDKVEAIKNIALPNTKKQLRRYKGLIKYNRDMWKHNLSILTPLSNMTSKPAKWNWSKAYREAFCTIKKLVSRETLLSYPNFNKQFVIHTDASKLQFDQ